MEAGRLRAVPADYPDDPDELAGLVLDYAGAPPRLALDIGDGPGTATRLFASRGHRVTATDPDDRMLARSRCTTWS